MMKGAISPGLSRKCGDVLTEEDYSAVRRHLVHPQCAHAPRLRENGSCGNDEPDAIARESGITVDALVKTIARAKGLLLERRNKRTAPVIDTMMYTSLNGMMISILLQGLYDR